MWVRVKDFKKATMKTIGYGVTIFLYQLLIEDLPTMLGVSDLSMIQIWINGEWSDVSKLNVVVYTIMGMLILSAWIGGAVSALANLIAGLVLYFKIFAPSGTIGLRVDIEEFDFSYTLNIMPIFIIFIAAYSVVFIIELLRGVDYQRDRCLSPIAIDNYRLSQAEKNRIADWIAVHEIGKKGMNMK